MCFQRLIQKTPIVIFLFFSLIILYIDINYFYQNPFEDWTLKENNMKTLIMLSAIPASGKSTWAKEYQRTHPNTYIVSSDDIRVEICGTYQDHSRQAEVWALFEKRIHEYGARENATVILDALNDVNTVRLKYLKGATEFDKKILVLFPSTLEKSQKYNGQREEEVRVPPDILIGLFNKFEAPNQEVLDLVDEVIEVNW